jgi:hypothetical protein
MPIPEEIKRHRPTDLGALEIRYIGGYYYVYRISSVWDRNKKRAKKKTGECIGKITESDGFLPNERFLRSQTPLKAYVKCYGVYELFTQLAPEVTGRLKECFPDVWRELLVISLLRLAHRFTAKNAKRLFEASYLKDLYPDVALCPNTVAHFMTKLGERRDEMVLFMRRYVQKGSKLVFDGTNIFTAAYDSYVQKGYNNQGKRDTQIRLLYVFDREGQAPVFYRLLPGNIVDKASLMATISECNARDVLVIADKGFYSKTNVSYLMEYGLQFILPLQDNTRMIDDAFASNLDRRKFDGVFIYHGRQIWYKKQPTGDNGNYLYIFLDEGKKQKEETCYLEKLSEEYEGLSTEGFFTTSRRGLFAFVSNLDTDCKHIYLDYKSRWDIEQCFDYLKNTVHISAPYQNSNEKLEAWAFLNHVSLLFFYSLVKAMRANRLDDTYTPEDVIDMCRNIVQVHCDNGQTFISETTAKVKDLLDQLGVDLFRKN